LKNKVVVVAAAAVAVFEPWKSIIFQHIRKEIACNDLLIKEKWLMTLSCVSIICSL
jgi:hypothetical protein